MSLPAAGIKYCLNKVLEVAEAEYYDDEALKEQLMLIALQFEEGEIDEAEYRRREAPILVRMREIKAFRKQLIEEEIAARKAGEAIDEGKRVVIDLPDELR